MTNFQKLKTGEKLSETQYYQVEKIVGDKVQLKNDFDEAIVVTKDYVEKCLVSAEQFDSEKKMSRTDIVNLFLSSPNVVLTVNYNKQIKEDEVKRQLCDLYPNKGGKLLSEADFTKRVNECLTAALVGEERTMTGRHYGQKDEFGRIRFIDMEQVKDTSKDYDTRQRLVDPRTINWLIVKGIKYITK